MMQEQENLLQRLEQYSKSDYYPLHMPGHKRRISHFGQPFAIDITEIEGFDNLFHAEGILLEAQQRAAKLYGADETYYLINGSSCGILAAVSASVRRGGRLLMSRNSHKASYHAAFLNGLHVSYLYPEADMLRGINGAVRAGAVREALEQHPDIQAVLITSPTYDGVESDIREIALQAHQAGAVLIVDAAHGAHFGMHPYFPEHALDCGADIVINSLHKTLPSLTQTALLHVKGPVADRERIRKYLGIYQSSSPSYVLMAGMDACIGLLDSQGAQLFDAFADRLENMRAALRGMQTLHLVDGQEAELYCYDYDRSKVLVSTERSRLTGPELAGILRREYHLEPEMEAEHYVTAIMTAADTQEGFERLTKALLEIDGRLSAQQEPLDKEDQKVSEYQSRACARWLLNEEALCIEEAENRPDERIPIQDSTGRISAEYAYLYPPGIPLLVPGERISAQLVERLGYYRRIGLNVQGLSNYSGGSIRVVMEAGYGAKRSEKDR